VGYDQSNLSSSLYGYDFVVATTQASINATMKNFMSSIGEPEVKICYVADAVGNPTRIDYSDLLNLADGSDPFSVPDGADPATDKDLLKLQKARFMVGFKARIGDPPGYAPTSIPDIVTLGTDTSAVTFRLMCSELIVVQLTPAGGYNTGSWLNASQPQGNAWFFTSKVDMRMFSTGENAYDKLPPAVREQIKNLGNDAFSVKQLLFDLDNAALETVPEMYGVSPGTPLYRVLQQYFIGEYFTAMRAQGEPLLGCAITRPGTVDRSTFSMTDLNIEVSPFRGSTGSVVHNPTPEQQDLATLNYLCETDSDRPLPPVRFDWNWIDSLGDRDGVLSINRNTFANYFKQLLMNNVSACCYLPYVRVWLSGFLDTDVNFQWSLTNGQTPTVTMPVSGSTVLKYNYYAGAEDKAGPNGSAADTTLSTSMDVSVDFSGNTIVVTRHLVVYLKITRTGIDLHGNVVDRTITDTYTLTVDQDGKLLSKHASVPVDISSIPTLNGFDNFFIDLNSVINKIHDSVAGFSNTWFKELPVSFPQSFVFPGGNTFLFKDVQFSSYQDLTAGISYADPTSVNLSTFRTDPRPTLTASCKSGGAA